MIQETVKKTHRGIVDISPDPLDENTDISFGDSEPDESLRAEIRNFIHRIYEHTPDGSVIRGTFTKVKKGYKGVFKICHSGGQMIAEGLQRTADETIQVLENQIWNKIKNWRKTRFV